MHTTLDDLIPFNEYFIVPYLLWFLYVAAAIAYFFFTSKDDYYRLCTFLFTGMTISLLVCTPVSYTHLHENPQAVCTLNAKRGNCMKKIIPILLPGLFSAAEILAALYLKRQIPAGSAGLSMAADLLLYRCV